MSEKRGPGRPRKDDSERTRDHAVKVGFTESMIREIEQFMTSQEHERMPGAIREIVQLGLIYMGTAKGKAHAEKLRNKRKASK